MIPAEVLASLHQIVVLMERDRDTALKYKKKTEKEDVINSAFWAGKYVGFCVTIGILKDRIESWEAMNEYELEDMGEDEYEKSEKDALWGGE